MSRIIFTDDQRACRILINPVYNAWPQNAVDTGKILFTVEHDRINERAAIMSGRRMYDHILWFIYNENIFIFIKDGQGNLFGRNGRFRCVGNLKTS